MLKNQDAGFVTTVALVNVNLTPTSVSGTAGDGPHLMLDHISSDGRNSGCPAGLMEDEMSGHFEEMMLRHMDQLVGTVARVADAAEANLRAQHMGELVEALELAEDAMSDVEPGDLIMGYWSGFQDALARVRATLAKIEGEK